MNVSGETFMPENSRNEDESLTAEGQLFSYICSRTGRSYDLTEYVNDTNRQYAETLTAYTVNSGATESYSYAGNRRLSRNNIWDEARGVRCNQTSYYQYDGRGSVTANTWHNGMVTSVYRYDPYGQVELGSTKHTDFYGYNGESYNPNSGLEYLRARHYSASQGRFFQEDTYLGDVADPLTLNRYAYVKNSPMNYVDPSGHITRNTERDRYDTPSNYLPTAEEFDIMGEDLKNMWLNAYSAAETTEQQWEIVDATNNLLYGNTESILEFIVDNPAYAAGAIAGAGIYLLAVYATGGAAIFLSKPFEIAGGVLVSGAFAGQVTGTIHSAYNQGQIRKILADEYGIDINKVKSLDLEKLPDAALELCNAYQEYDDKMDAYQRITQKALALAMLLLIAQGVYDTGKTVEYHLQQQANKGGSGATGTENGIKGIKPTQEVIPGTNVPKSFVMEGKYVNGKEVWVHGNATKHMGEYINSAKGSVLVESEMMQSFNAAVDQVLAQPLQPGRNFFSNIGGWEIGINGETGVIYHALMN